MRGRSGHPRTTRLAAGTILFGLLLLPAAASADEASTSSRDADLGLASCSRTIDGLKAQLAHVALLGNVFTLVGAGVAGLCSAIAGGSTGKKSAIAAAIGVAGAIVAALPKTLPDRADIQRKISLADQHRVRGEKTVGQLGYLHGSFTDTCRQYAISRFIECTAEEPSANVPDLPLEQPGATAFEQEATGPLPTVGKRSAPDTKRNPAQRVHLIEAE
jgi:hypothetical protein